MSIINQSKNKIMFSIFKKKSKVDKLDDQYRKLLKEAHRLSTVNRKLSDEKMAEADLLLKEIEKLELVNSSNN